MIWNIVIGICSFISYISIWLIVRHFKFVVPFTNEMVSLGIIAPPSGRQLIFVDLIGTSFTHVISQLICLVGIYFHTSMGIKVYAIVAVITLFLFRPSRDRYTRSRYTITQYIQSHSVCMDLDKMRELSK